VTAALLGVAILGETISASLVIGLACVAWGLFWAHRN
jgi:drug/metabolite transporter (DMT)-like permease